MEPQLLHSVTDSVATVVIHHPAKRNAMTAAMWAALPPLLDALAADPGVRALVLTGEGSTFCAGADISTLRGSPEEAQSLAVRAEEALAAFPKPTLAAIRGHCVGGGSQLAAAQWTTQEWQHFLGALPRGLTAAQLGDLDRAFRLSEQGNSEILFAWLQIAVRHRYEPAMPALERFLTSQGRRKFVRSRFTSLMAEGEWGQALARRIYERARPGYHPLTVSSVDEIVRM